MNNMAKKSRDIFPAAEIVDQPFGSMPRDCNSLRMMRFIHAETEASPSCANAFFIPSSSDGSTRSAICLLPFPFISMVDIR